MSGLPVKQVEERLAALACRPYARLAHRATTVLVALLRALALPPGSEVLMPVALCANPANAVRWAGLRPLFADILPHTFNLNLDAAESVVGPQTKVLLVVPLFGHPLDGPALLRFAARHGLLVIEDAAQAVGLRHASREPTGSIGICSIYSFGGGKIADAGGGAALLSDDLDLLTRAQVELARLPSGPRHLSAQAGRILNALDTLPSELVGRASLACLYRQTLTAPEITHPPVTLGAPLWKYSVLLPNRDERDRVTRALLATGVPATNLYPPLSRFFSAAREEARYPVACDVFDRIINLPLWPQPPGLLEDAVEAFRI
jgi:dTDP-4-amino-4,6-dideoxygalactose transaminase